MVENRSDYFVIFILKSAEMGRKYMRKSSRQSWPVSSMQAAVEAVRIGLKTGSAARIYGVPKKTLLRYIAKQEDLPSVTPLGRFKPILSTEQENEIVNRIIQMARSAIGVNRREIRQMAFQIAEKYSVAHPWTNGIAGVDWLRNFLRRHPEISARKPENTSLARLTGFNRASVQSFYDALFHLMSEEQYSATQIWNVDETGFSTVQARAMEVFAKKGQRQVASASSSERGINTTVILAMSAAGEYVPPAFIFPRARLTESLKVGAPENSLFLCNPSGWSTIETCSSWFDHFLKYAKPSASRPVLLILDGHASHTKNIYMLEKASVSNVRILSIPSHTSHKLQPLDVSVMGPVKRKYADVMDKFIKSSKGKVAVTVNDVAALVKEALAGSATVSNAMSGFRATGIYPFDRNIFTDSDFSAADFLESTIQSNSQPNSQPNAATAANIVETASTVETGSTSHQPTIDSTSGVLADITNHVDVMSNLPSHIMSNLPTIKQDMESSNNFTSEIDFMEDFEAPEDEPIIIDPNVFYLIAPDGKIMIESESEASTSVDQEAKFSVDAQPPVEPVKVEPTSYVDEEVATSGDLLSPTTIIQPWNLSTITDSKPSLKKCTNNRKGRAEELTSVTYRKQLREASASRAIKDIIKKERKKPITSRPEDSLCVTCGERFSSTSNGSGWSNCMFCHTWYHCKCNAEDPLLCAACR